MSQSSLITVYGSANRDNKDDPKLQDIATESFKK